VGRWVSTGQTADAPFSGGDLADRLQNAVPKGASRSRLNGIKASVESGRYGSGKKGAKNFRNSFMPALVKGAGLMEEIGSPLATRQETSDRRVIEHMADFATATLKEVVKKGIYHPDKATKGFSGPLAAAITTLNRFSPQAIAGELMATQWSKEIGTAFGKSFSLSSPLSSGFVPFDLIPFVRTIYPVYTPLRNKLPRVPGQGEYHRGKILASITGSLPNNLGSLQDDSTSEFFGGSGFSEWPNPLPASGSQSAYDIIIPYKFYALTESTSWLAQFAGQGFDDLYGLSSLVLLQEFMLLEEHDILASTSQALSTPSTPTLAARTAGSNETALSGVTTNVFVKVTAINYWGQTASSTGASVAWSAGDVVDVTIVPVAGAISYVLYVTTGASAGTYYQFETNTNGGVVGGIKFTLQGALPTSGTTAPTTDTGTYATTRSESLISVLSGQAYNGGSGPYPNVSAGYFNNAEGKTLSVAVLQTALQQMYNGANGYFANPSEIQTSPTDAVNLANSIQNESIAAYQLRVQQSEMAGVTAGIAVANVVNPVTRSAPEIVVHPYLPQGNALLMSYTLPQTQNNLGNVVEMAMVQDYAQIGWPVIDPAFRQSILRYGTFFMPAPQYCGLIQGLQNSASTPYS
jgi:hypothetical protein